jgi:hypothetical protein
MNPTEANALPKIPGESDDLKAMKYAMQLCLRFSSDRHLGGDAASQAEAKRAAAILASLVDTAEGFDKSLMERLDFLEGMLRQDGKAIVLYLDHDRMRQKLQQSDRMDLAAQLTEQFIDDVVQDAISFQHAPELLIDWTEAVEEIACNMIMAKHPRKPLANGKL